MKHRPEFAGNRVQACMIIREANARDAAGIAAVVHTRGELRSVTSHALERTTKTVTANLEQMARAKSSTAYVAENSDGSIAGYCAVHWVPFLFLPGGEAYVTEIFVHTGETGKGIGSMLLETVVTEATRRECSRVSLLNGRDSQSYLREFYRKRGWLERDRMANFILPLPPPTRNPSLPER